MNEFITTIKSCIGCNGNNEIWESKARVRIIEVRELTNFEVEKSENKKPTRFFPIYKNNRKNVLNLVKIKIR